MRKAWIHQKVDVVVILESVLRDPRIKIPSGLRSPAYLVTLNVPKRSFKILLELHVDYLATGTGSCIRGDRGAVN